MMAIVDGDVLQYEQLKRLSVEDYLFKLSNFIDRVEPYLKQKQEIDRAKSTKKKKK